MKRIKPHRIGNRGVALFNVNLPANEIIDFLFNEMPQQNDYGVDGIIQVIIKELHTGEFYAVQIKGEEKVKINSEGKIIFYLEHDKAIFVMETLKEPLAFILCDTTENKVYWHDIQTNPNTIKAYEYLLNGAAKTLKIEIDPSYSLPSTADKFYKYLNEAAVKIRKREEFKRMSEMTLQNSVEEISTYEKSLQIKGYDIIHGSNISIDDRKRVVMSLIDTKSGKELHYIPNKEFSHDDIMKINSTFKFPKTPIGEKQFKELREMLDGKRDEVEIDSENIEKIEALTGSKVISRGSDKVRISKSKTEIEIYLKNGSGEEIKLKAELWFSVNNEYVIDSSRYDNQPIEFKLRMNLQTSKGSYSFKLNDKVINNIPDAVLYENFVYEIKDSGEISTFINGMKRHLTKFKATSSNVLSKDKDPFFKLLCKLKFIEEKTNVKFPFPLPEVIPYNEIKTINTVYDLLKKGTSKINITISFKSKKPIGEDKNIVIDATIDYSILGIPINLPTNKIRIAGIIDKMENLDGKYRLTLNNAEITFRE